jgi:hypothetical protein
VAWRVAAGSNCGQSGYVRARTLGTIGYTGEPPLMEGVSGWLEKIEKSGEYYLAIAYHQLLLF